MAATTAPTCSGSIRASGACRSTHSYTLTCLPSQVANTHPSVVRRTCGAGMPAAQAASWNAVAESHLALAGLVKRHLHRPAAVSGVQPPHKPLLAPRDRPVRQPGRPAETKPPGDLYGIHQATPAHLRERCQDRRRRA